MSWTTLTQDDIARRLTSAEMAAVTTSATATGQTPGEILSGAIASTTREVRGYVAAYSANVLGPEGTLPDELEGAALALLRRYLYTRLPGTSRLMDEARRKETDDALAQLRDVAAGRFRIVPPASAAPEQAAAGGVTLVHHRPTIAGRNQTAGL